MDDDLIREINRNVEPVLKYWSEMTQLLLKEFNATARPSFLRSNKGSECPRKVVNSTDSRCQCSPSENQREYLTLNRFQHRCACKL
jgi:hypothetical protein